MSYYEQLRTIADSYFSEHDGTASARDIAAWAISAGRWEAQPGSLIHDADSYNDTRQPVQPIQVIFDFSLDLAELEAARTAAA